MPTKTKVYPTQAELRELFSHEPETGRLINLLEHRRCLGHYADNQTNGRGYRRVFI